MRRATPLTARQVSTKGPGVYGDGNGLYLYVTETGRSWQFRYQIAGSKRRNMGIGSVTKVTLAKAREIARELQTKVADGIDPIDERRQQRGEAAAVPTDLPTFQDCAEACVASKRSEWRAGKHVKQWEQSLAKHVYPGIGHIPVRDITVDHVLLVLEPIWNSIPETASRIRNRIETILDYAVGKRWRPADDINPAIWGGRLKILLGKVAIRKIRKRESTGADQHFKSLPYTEAPQFVSWLQTKTSLAAPIIEFVILTGSRLSEAREAEWKEIDWTNRIWTVPGHRMKGGKPHRKPLSAKAVEFLREQQSKNLWGSKYVFPGDTGSRPASEEATYDFLWRNGYRGVLTTHGFRSTLREWIAAQGARFTWNAGEAMLAHALPKVAGIYQGNDVLEERREIVEAWADFLYSTGTAIPIKRAAG